MKNRKLKTKNISGRLYLFLFISLFFVLGVFKILTGNSEASDPVIFPQETWLQATPEERGLNSSKLNEFATKVGGTGVVIKDGYLVKSWGDPASHGEWGSASKPVVSTMLFFAIEEGKLSGVDDLIENWGWNLIEKDKTMTFRHLANMTSGYARGEGPGEAWGYNDYAIKLYKKTLFERVFGISNMADAAAVSNLINSPEYLGPLQFQDGSLIVTTKGTPRINMTPRDYARVGWLWLNKGNWDGVQILPVSYFDNYMKPDVAGDLPRTTLSGTDYLAIGTEGGTSDQTPYGPGIYGFNWWFNSSVGTTGNLAWPNAPADLIMANGHWSKEIMVVIPSLNMVVAARGNWGKFAPGVAGATMNLNLKLLAEAAIPQGSSTPVPSGSADPTPLPQPTSTPGNSTPVIKSRAPVTATKDIFYSWKIGGVDANLTDSLTFTASGLPVGLDLVKCAQTVTTQVVLTCYVEGVPLVSGTNSVTLTLTDSQGANASANYSLVVN